jgi:putative transposase
VVLSIRRDGQKVLAVRNMGSESEAAWRGLLDDLIRRGLTEPSFVIIDGAAGLEKALGLVWPDALMQRCAVHKHRNLLAHAPERLHEEVSADYNDMIYAGTAKEIETRRKSSIRKWRLKCRAVADSLEEAGDRLFTFSRLPMAVGTYHQCHRATARGVQTPHQDANRAAVGGNSGDSVWALLASGQIPMRKVDG